MDNKIKHLEFIQNVVTRMANNSFMLKGWAVTLVAGVFVLSAKDAAKTYFLIAYIPIIVFWILDSYYLMEEKRYRKLYDIVRGEKEEDIDFSLDCTAIKNSSCLKEFFNRLFSKTEVIFYVPLALVCALVITLSFKIDL